MAREIRAWVTALCAVAVALGAGVAYVHSFAAELAVLHASVERLDEDIRDIDVATSKSTTAKRAELKEMRNRISSIDRRVTVLCAKLIGDDCEP